jgi:hypothetical protein
MASAMRIGMRVSLGDRELSIFKDDPSDPCDEHSCGGWQSPPELVLRAEQFVELDNGRRVIVESPMQMIFAFSGNVEFIGEYQLDHVCESLRDAIFEDEDQHRRARPADAARWSELIRRLSEAGVVGATKPSLRALPCVVEFEQEVADSVGIETDRILSRTVEARPPRRTELPPAELRRAVELITSDLEPGGASGITLSVEPDREDNEMWMVYVRGPDGGGGSGFVLGQPFPELVAMLAELVQDQVIDSIWREWPACARHGHPLGIYSDDDAAWWVCGTDPSWRRAIGTLADDEAYVAAIRRRS